MTKLGAPERWLIDDLAKLFTKHFGLLAEGEPFIAFILTVCDEEGIELNERALRTYLQLRKR